jgi:hypothetical protein
MPNLVKQMEEKKRFWNTILPCVFPIKSFQNQANNSITKILLDIPMIFYWVYKGAISLCFDDDVFFNVKVLKNTLKLLSDHFSSPFQRSLFIVGMPA